MAPVQVAVATEMPDLNRLLHLRKVVLKPISGFVCHVRGARLLGWPVGVEPTQPRFTVGARCRFGFGHNILVRSRTSPSTFARSRAAGTLRGRSAVPRPGLEPLSASDCSTDNLGPTSIQDGAESGAVATEAVRVTPKALAAALLSLSPADRARLAALLIEKDKG